MASEELDFYDSDYAEQEEDYYDSDDDDVYNDGGDDVFDDDDGVDFGLVNTSKSSNRYTNLTEDEIRQRQKHEISHVSSILSIHEVAASKLLHYFKWNVSQLHDEWFADEAKVRETVGLPSVDVDVRVRSSEENPNSVLCGICFDVIRVEDMYPLVCGHMYCRECWRGYLTVLIDEGPGCLSVRCPEPSCSVAVCRDVVEELVGEERKRKYSRYFLTSFVEVSKKIKWCPAPGCDNAVEMELIGDGNFDVTCLCSYAFCWNCGEDAHRPVKCETVAKWVLKNSSESENTAWILANSKSCPKCKRFIEKNKGCMHMTCTEPCKYQFCWLCLGDWKTHGEKTGGYYTCNVYESAKQRGEYQQEESIRKMAKDSLERYTHYYERWASNQKSRDQAIQELKKIQTESLQKISDMTKEPVTQLKFITDAWNQIIECRRVLKWSYAYGYYLPEGDRVHKQFFEYSQGQAESNLERLHKCAEEDLNVFLQAIDKAKRKEDDDDPTPPPTEEDFRIFRQKLIDLTNATHSYFAKVVQYLETQAP